MPSLFIFFASCSADYEAFLFFLASFSTDFLFFASYAEGRLEFLKFEELGLAGDGA